MLQGIGLFLWVKRMKEFKSFYKTVEGNEGNKCMHPTRLDTYGCGCQHNCSYCYARSLLDFRGMWDSNEPAVAPIAEREKKKLIEPLNFAEISVCEDESMAYVYWKYHVNNNPDDCCNLRRTI